MVLTSPVMLRDEWRCIMKTSSKMISMSVIAAFGMALTAVPSMAQPAEKVQAKPQETTAKVADLTFKRGLFRPKRLKKGLKK